MTTGEKIRKTAEIIEGNRKNISWLNRIDQSAARTIRDLENFTFPEGECTSVAQDVVDKLYDLAVYALNNGFDSDVCNAINDLAECAEDLMSEKAAKHISRIREKSRNAYARVDKKQRSGKPDIKQQVYSYVDSSVEYTEMQAESWGESSSTGANFRRSKEKLLRIRALVESALADNTRSAADLAHKINGVIIKWRKKVDQGACTAADAAALDEAITIAQERNACVRYDGTASKKDIYVYGGNDTIGIVVVRLRQLDESVAVFRENYDMRMADIEKIENDIATLDKKENDINKEIAGLENQINEVMLEYDNGRRSKSETNFEIGRLVRRIDSLKTDRSDVQTRRSKLTRIKQAKSRRLWLLETVIEKYEQNKHVPELLWKCIQNFDIGVILRVVDGNASQEVVSKVEETMKKFKVLDLTVAGREQIVDDFIGDLREEEREEEEVRVREEEERNRGRYGNQTEEVDYIALARERGIVKPKQNENPAGQDRTGVNLPDEESNDRTEISHARPFDEDDR